MSDNKGATTKKKVVVEEKDDAESTNKGMGLIYGLIAFFALASTVYHLVFMRAKDDVPRQDL